jgi:hypothetical protein
MVAVQAVSMVGGTIFHREMIQREISRVLVLNLSAKKRCPALLRTTMPLTEPSLLSRGTRQRFIKLGKETEREDRNHLIRGRLIHNVTEGTDKGAMSAKILGSDSELNMWQPDQMTGMIILQVPPQLANLTDEERARMLTPPEE